MRAPFLLPNHATWWLAVACWLAAAMTGFAPPAARGQELAELLREDFSQGSARWKPLETDGWRLEQDGDNAFFHQFRKPSTYRPPHRSPFHIAKLDGVRVRDFELTARVRSTHPDYDHRDACVMFGIRDAAHFYYVHFGKKTDDHANQIFIVDGKPRTKISTKTSPGTPWDDAWHTVRVVRDTTGDHAGRIRVYFDDLKRPVMEARDKSFLEGEVGIGSFDDTTAWDDIVLRGVTASR